MDNNWDIYEFLGIPAGDDTGGAAQEGFSNHDSFSFPLLVDTARNEYHDPIDNTSHRMAAQAQPTTAPYGGGGGGALTENFPLLFQSLHQRQLQMLKDHNEKNRVGFHAQAARLRRKKSTTLEVRMRFEMIPKDSWSWRKYGQKPIKGSPYPRSYYRCSSSRSCTARKQVELSQDNPEEYIVSYIGHHTHAKPSSLRSNAGSTRHPSPPCAASPSTAAAAAVTCPAPTGTPSIVPNHDGEDTQNDDDDNSIPEADDNNDVDDQEDDEIILIPNNQIAEELFVAMHGFKPMPPAGGN